MKARVPRFTEPALDQLVVVMAEDFKRAGGRALLVGGAVRDAQLNTPAGDVDFEVYGLSADRLEAICAEYGKVNLVGKQFAVLHVATTAGQIEVSMPRRESKTGPGHKGFAVSADPDMSPRDAAARRDFTVNAMMFDPLSEELFDPWDGMSDLRRGLLRHVSAAFSEDPLRALRAARFAARHDWQVAPETVALCRSLDLSELPAERIEAELRDILLRGKRPGLGLQVLEDVGALRILPELAAMRGVPQDPVWHPEGDVFHHTCLCLDAAASIRSDMENPWAEMLGVMCHDLGKATCTIFERGRWRSAEHDTAGARLAKKLLSRFTRQEDLINLVVAYVREHLRPTQLAAADKVGDAAIRRLALRVDIPGLVRVSWADAAGRIYADMPAWEEWEAGRWLISRAAALGVKDQAPQPFLLGRDLLARGMTPGREIGRILEEAFELQLDGELADSQAALAWLEQRIGDRASGS